jgi:hypothetical protein
VACRNLNAVAIIDWETHELVWSWGPGKISGVHSAGFLPNGRILLFDNGVNRKWSRVIELDPLADEIVWEYQAAPPESFFTARQGACQRLPNGNTLISNSESGEVFEVTEDKAVVWRYLSPHKNQNGHRCVILAERLGSEGIERILKNRPSMTRESGATESGQTSQR